jgi:RimJ/RimL family protein N-acetyltransferase
MVKFLEGEKVCLRPLLKSDLNERYLAWLNNPQITLYSKLRNFPTNEKDLEGYLEGQRSSNRVVMAVCIRQTDEHIGNVVLEDIDWIDRTAQVTILIGVKKYWGSGHFLDSFRLVHEYAFKNLNLRRLYAGSENPGVVVSLQKLGWRKEGVLKKHRFRDGGYVDVIAMAILKEDYERSIQSRNGR